MGVGLPGETCRAMQKATGVSGGLSLVHPHGRRFCAYARINDAIVDRTDCICQMRLLMSMARAFTISTCSPSSVSPTCCAALRGCPPYT